MFKFKSLTVIVSVVMLLSSSAFAVEDKPCKMLTSPADYSTMKVVTADAFAGFYPNYKSGSGLVPFSDAYVEFYASVKSYAQSSCNKYDYKGVVNLSTKFAVTDRGYFFTAQFDLIK